MFSINGNWRRSKYVHNQSEYDNTELTYATQTKGCKRTNNGEFETIEVWK